MLFGCSLLLIAAGFLTEVPDLLRDTVAPKAETTGVFVQTKRDQVRTYVTRGTYRLRPGEDFEWVTKEPFESRFYATKTNYVYSNEDETVEKALKDLRGGELFATLGEGDLGKLFETFDVLYKEEDGKFFLKAKPKERRLKRALAKVEAEGRPKEWTMTATFPNGVTFTLELKDN